MTGFLLCWRERPLDSPHPVMSCPVILGSEYITWGARARVNRSTWGASEFDIRAG
ncbi:hypothetical protein A2U01_0088542 [Trifolium medium]|uniref:Uncharacterized protein n=1 Tax=Trifolium medium TaxID=97028 RepID=A0A392U3K6_9FABA|nr:hypothetical protein [Trifolium medium]